MPKQEQKQQQEQEPKRPRPFWSGSIAFGLVNLPVSLFVANRSSRVRLRMVDDSGTPLSRRYFCPKHEKALTADEIVRGYEVDKERFVVVEDDELDAAAPKKSREIDLRRFVPLHEIDAMYVNRAYFLVPDEGAIKAYRLLAKSMQDEQRAGIATFVMRGKQHLVAIIAEKGILRAETLRFHDELPSPDDIGLPPIEQGDNARIQRFKKSINSRARKTLKREQLSDRHSEAIRKRIDRKLKAGEDVVDAPEVDEPEQGAQDDAEGGDNVIDLMQVLKDSLRQKESSSGQTKSPPKKKANNQAKKTGGKKKSRPSLDSMSKTELYNRAQELDISGRSSMSKAQLVQAIDKHG